MSTKPGGVDLAHELARLHDGVLTGHRVGGHQHVVGLRDVLDPAGLLHHLGVDVQPARGVDDDDVGVLTVGFLQALLRDLHGILALGPDGNPDLASQGAELLDRGGALQVGRDQQRALALGLEVGRDLRAGGRLARALHAGHHDHRRAARSPPSSNGAVLAAERHGELLVHDLHHLLAGREALHDLFGERSLADPRQEVVGHLERDVGLEQRGAHIGQRVVDLFGMELAAGTQLAEGAVEPFGEGVEHRASSVVGAGAGAARILPGGVHGEFRGP